MMTAREYLKKHEDILLSALEDYLKWFDVDEPTEGDKAMVDCINEAINELQEIKL